MRSHRRFGEQARIARDARTRATSDAKDAAEAKAAGEDEETGNAKETAQESDESSKGRPMDFRHSVAALGPLASVGLYYRKGNLDLVLLVSDRSSIL
jgi:hypothetical protein